MKPLRWGKVLLSAAVLAGVVAIAVWGPVWMHERDARAKLRADRLAAARALDREGLRACGATRGEPARLFPPRAGDVEDFSFSSSPGAHVRRNPWQVSVSGTSVRVVELQDLRFPPIESYPPRGSGLPDPSFTATRLVGQAELDPEQARVVTALVRAGIQNSDERPFALMDAGSQLFFADGKCAQQQWEGWSAGGSRLTLLAEILALRATRTPDEDAGRTTRALDILLRSFEHRDGSEFERFVPGHFDDRVFGKLGPDWTPSARARSKQMQSPP